jgi:response regulator RpfG family c-di-GMP phosphodiesterase
MHEEDEDKPTVILDFNKLKEELVQEEELLNDQEVDQLFAEEQETQVPTPEEKNYSETSKQQNNIYLLDYNNEYFKENEAFSQSSYKFKLIKELNQLNEVLTLAPDCLIVFYYNAHPKVINQLTGQIKTKFPQTKTLIIAKNLSAQKAQQHSQSKYGTTSYLSDPFDEQELTKTLKSIIEQ